MVDNITSLYFCASLRQVPLPLRCAHRDRIHVDDMFPGSADTGGGVGGCSGRATAVTVDTDMLTPVEPLARVEPSARWIRGDNALEERVGDVVIHAELITVDMYLRRPAVSLCL